MKSVTPARIIPGPLTQNSLELVSLRKEDMPAIKDWRNAQLSILRQKKVLTDEDQNAYFSQVVLPAQAQSNPQQILFSYLEDKILVGYGGLVHISWENYCAEMSFLLNPQYVEDRQKYDFLFSNFIHLVANFAFDTLSLNRIYTETYATRFFHMKLLEYNGFSLEGRLREHVFLDEEKKFVDAVFHGLLNPNFNCI